MAGKTQGELKAEAFDRLKPFRFQKLTKELVEEVEKGVNELLSNWLKEDELIYHAGLPVGSITIESNCVGDEIKNVKIKLNRL